MQHDKWRMYSFNVPASNVARFRDAVESFRYSRVISTIDQGNEVEFGVLLTDQQHEEAFLAHMQQAGFTLETERLSLPGSDEDSVQLPAA